MDTVLRGCQGNLLPDDGAKVSDILWLSVKSTSQTQESRGRGRKHEARVFIVLIFYLQLKNNKSLKFGKELYSLSYALLL